MSKSNMMPPKEHNNSLATDSKENTDERLDKSFIRMFIRKVNEIKKNTNN